MCVEYSNREAYKRKKQQQQRCVVEHTPGRKTILSADKSECAKPQREMWIETIPESEKCLYFISNPPCFSISCSVFRNILSLPMQRHFSASLLLRLTSLTSICFVCSPSTPPSPRPLALSTWTDEIHFINTPKMFSDMLFSRSLARSFVRHASFLSSFLSHFVVFCYLFPRNKQKAEPNKHHIDTSGKHCVRFLFHHTVAERLSVKDLSLCLTSKNRETSNLKW